MLGMAAGARAEDVWRLAGTFNGWSPANDAWRMTALPDGRWYFRSELEPGRYQFKFVRNGDWGAGHLGAGSGAGTLAQPGADLEVEVGADRVFQAALDVNGRTWSQTTPIVTEAVPIVVVRGVARRGVPLAVDVTRSLTPAGQRIAGVKVESAGGAAIREVEASGATALIVPLEAGELTLHVAVRTEGSEQWSRPASVSLSVRGRISMALVRGEAVHGEGDRLGGEIDLVPVDQFTWAGVVDAPDTSVHSVVVTDEESGAQVSEQIYPQRAGERFGILYDLPTLRIASRPGDISIVEDAGGYRMSEKRPKVASGEVWHDTRRDDHVSPISEKLGLADISAWSDGEEIIGVDLLPGWAEGVAIPLERRIGADESKEWGGRIASGSGTLRYRLRARMRDGSQREYGPFEAVVRPLFETPDWAKAAVWYQVFPERFRNGNPRNDPHGPDVFAAEWTAPWSKALPGEFAAWQARVRSFGENPDMYDRRKKQQPGGRFYNVIWDRRYGGDLQGVIEKLDELKQMGVTALYLNPVFEAPSSHKYDTSDFRHVDDNFGGTGETPERWTANPDEELARAATWTWTDADQTLLQLIKEAHERGMRIILDGVFNHVGRQHPAFADVLQRGKTSPYVEWFYAEFDEAGKLKAWRAWDQPNGWLPKFRQNADGSLVEPVKEHIFDITQRWMDPNGDGDGADGIDGWRLDVALDVGAPFWREWVTFVKFINPDAYIVAEIWKDDEAVAHLRGDQFDAQMQYPVAATLADWLAMRPGMTGDEAGMELERIFGNDRAQTQLAQFTLLESHDTDRFVSNLFNARAGRAYDSGNRPQDGEMYREEKPDAQAYARARLAAIVQATLPGAPVTYYGAEVGMFGADDPSCRKPRPWPDLDEMRDTEDRGDWALEEELARWLRLRRDDQVLQLGSYTPRQTGSADVLAFERQLNEQKRLIIVNKGAAQFDASGLIGEAGLGPVVVGPMDGVMIDVTRRGQ